MIKLEVLGDSLLIRGMYWRGGKKQGKSNFFSGDRDISQCHWLFLSFTLLLKRMKTEGSRAGSP